MSNELLNSRTDHPRINELPQLPQFWEWDFTGGMEQPVACSNDAYGFCDSTMDPIRMSCWIFEADRNDWYFTGSGSSHPIPLEIVQAVLKAKEILDVHVNM